MQEREGIVIFPEEFNLLHNYLSNKPLPASETRPLLGILERAPKTKVHIMEAGDAKDKHRNNLGGDGPDQPGGPEGPIEELTD